MPWLCSACAAKSGSRFVQATDNGVIVSPNLAFDSVKVDPNMLRIMVCPLALCFERVPPFPTIPDARTTAMLEANSGTLPQVSHEYQSSEGVGVMSALEFLRQLGLIVEV